MLARNLRPELAVMNALRRLGIKPGETVETADLVDAWPEYGLRSTDLQAALQRLGKRGLLRLENSVAGEQAMLTEAGQQWSDSMPGWLEYALLAPRREAHEFIRYYGRPARTTRMSRRGDVAGQARRQAAL